MAREGLLKRNGVVTKDIIVTHILSLLLNLPLLWPESADVQYQLG